MAEKVCDLIKNGGSGNIKAMQFSVSNVAVDSAWGSFYTSAHLSYDTGVNLTGKKVFLNYDADGNSSAWCFFDGVTDSTKVVATYIRPSSGTISGKLNVLIAD